MRNLIVIAMCAAALAACASDPAATGAVRQGLGNENCHIPVPSAGAAMTAG